LAAIVRSSADAVIGKGVDGVITSWNAGATLLYDREAQEMVGCSFESMVPPEALTEERVRHKRVVAGRADSGYHCVRLRGDGERIEVVMSLSPIFDDEGAVIGVASLSRRVSADEREQARFASLLEAAPDAIVCVDQAGRIVTTNAQVTALFGYDREELLGEDIERLLPVESRGRHVGLRSAFLLDPETRTMGTGLLLHGRRRDGSVFPIEVSLSPDRSQAETIVIAAIRDMTEQRRLEREARENETRLRQMAENVDVVFILRQIDPPAILYVSSAAVSVLGHDPSEWDDGNRVLTVHPLDRDWVERDLIPAVIAGLATEGEFRVLMPDGGDRWVRIVSRPVENPSGPAQRSVATVENIDARVKAAEALRLAEAAAVEANQAKNQFLSRMSHELRTPMNAVLGFAQLLEMRLTDSDDTEAINQILKGGRHLLELINDVLDIARIEAGETSISIEAISIAEVIGEALELMAPVAKAAGVMVRAPVLSAELMVLADRQRLRQILLNLLSNAIKYNQRGGRVWIVQQTDHEQVTVTVHDDGPGIPVDLQSRLFTAFDRLGAEASGVEGTGIGLALTRSLAELMHGTLAVDSEPGRGSAFTLALPRAETSPTANARPVAAEGTGAARGLGPESRTLLYIEDNGPNVRVLEHILNLRPEWCLMHAGSGGLGVELARGRQPDLVLLDLHLPDRPGTEVLRQLKDDLATSEIPVVVLTADASSGLSGKLTAAGASGFLTKPLSVAEILLLLDQTPVRPGVG
jgi:PAS domain S-box-containing protein